MGATVGFTPTVTLSDNHSGTDTRGFGWVVSYAAPLTLSTASGSEGNAASLYAGTDPSGNHGLTFSASALPQGLSINASTGLISGIAGYANAAGGTTATLSATLSVSDATGLLQSSTATFTISDTDRLPTPAAQSNSEGQTVSLDMHGTDNTGTNSLSYSSSSLPGGLSINSSTGLTSGTATTLGAYLVDVTASEGSNSISQVFAWDVLQAGLLNPGDQTSQESATVALTLHGFSGTSASLTWSAVSLSDGLSLNTSMGVISGTLIPGAAVDGPYAVSVVVSDGTAIGGQQFNWTVSPYVALTAPADESNTEGNSVSLALVATDAGTHTLSCTADGLPGGLSINASTGLISGTISSGDALQGPAVVDVTAIVCWPRAAKTWNPIARHNKHDPTCG